MLTPAGVQARSVDELPALLRGPDPVWVDVPAWDDEAAEALVEPLGLHAGAVRESAERNPLPKVHIYPDHVFVVLHAPEAGPRGHVHYVELDQFIGPNWLVTVHGPLGEGVDPTAATTETRAVLRRLESGSAPGRHRARAVPRAGDRDDRTAAGLPHHADPGGVAPAADRDGRAPRQRRGLPGGAVPRAARPAGGARHGGVGPPGLRADGDAGGLRRAPRGTCCATQRTSSGASRRWPTPSGSTSRA